jgi:hypothetical protein
MVYRIYPDIIYMIVMNSYLRALMSFGWSISDWNLIFGSVKIVQETNQ